MPDDHAAAHGHDQDHFDASARAWDDEAKVERARVVAEAVRSEVRIDMASRVLEYGAGTGLATEHLVEGGIGPTMLVEPSAGMREVMADKVADGRLPSSAEVVDLDLATDEPPDGEFDLVLTVMTLHHIPDLQPVLAAFARLLAPDGHLCIVDLVAEDGSFHAHLDDFHGHDGFGLVGLTTLLLGAGFAAPSWRTVHHVDKDGATYPLFLATTTLA